MITHRWRLVSKDTYATRVDAVRRYAVSPARDARGVEYPMYTNPKRTVARTPWGRTYGSTVMIAVLFSTLLSRFAEAHEPVFSLGPETIYQGGVGLETEFEYESGDDHHSAFINYEILYGLTKKVSLTLEIPQVLDVAEAGDSDLGIGDLQLRVKYQFYKRDFLGGQDKVAAIVGIKLPTGDDDSSPRLGTGSTDYLLGLSYGHESRSWYWFATLRYLLRGDGGRFDLGDRFLYDAAIGYRPWKREYLQWDFVGLLEMSGQHDSRGDFGGARVKNSGGDTVWLGPTGLLSYRNLMFKGGVQFPVYQDLNGSQKEDRYRAVFAIEYHF